MSLSDVTITRPVFAAVLSIIIVLVGAVAFTRLPIREYPNVDEPVVSVRTTYPGASPEIIEGQITQVIEDSVSGIDGIRSVTSTSRQETSQITVEFALGRNADDAAAEVRDRVNRVRGRLPDEVEEPVVAKVEADADPIIRLGFTSDRHSPMEISEYVDRFVRDRIQAIPGVAEVQIGGERRPSMRISLDPLRLAGFGLTPQDVEDALRRQNIEVPSGRIESTGREFTVLSETDLATPAQFGQVVLRVVDGFSVTLDQVARIDIAPRDDRQIIRFDGRNAVSLGVVRQATANPVDINRALREALPDIRADLPAGMNVGFAYNSVTFIERSIASVWQTMAEAVALVVLVIVVFLRSFRATLIPVITIPVSLIGAFALMAAFGFSVNTLTLLAMVLAIGLVVDDAIVVMENIQRHIEEGSEPLQAALLGAREIGFAVVAMTVTLAAVYVPVGFMTGRTGRLFSEFALTLAGAVVVSGFVALTLSPMMSARLLRPRRNAGRLYLWGEQALQGLASAYRGSLQRTLRMRPVVLAVAVGAAGLSAFTFSQLRSELSPAEDRGGLMVVGTGPSGATIDYMDAYVSRVEREVYDGLEDLDFYFVAMGFPVANQFRSFVGLEDWDDRHRSAQDLLEEIRPELAAIPGVRANPVAPPSLGARPFQPPVQFVVRTSATYEELDRAMQALLQEVRANPRLVNPDTDLRLNTPQLRVEVDRRRAADMGVPVETIGRTLETLLGGRQVTRFERAGEQYDVFVRAGDEDRVEPSQLESVHVRGAGGEMIPLSNLVTLRETVAPQELNRFDRLRSATLTANLAPGYSLGDALDWLETRAERVLPAGTQISYAGVSREFRESNSGMYLTFLLALAFIYLVLAAQFESWRDPLIILATVPLSTAGALLALWLTGNSLNVYSQIGLITLVGLITKHGILIVEFANQSQARGLSRTEAVLEAASLRLRPVLMTTSAMVLGSAPLAFAHGAGAEARQQIGWVIVGGMSLGTLLTLFVIPTVYTFLGRSRGASAAEEQREATREADVPPSVLAPEPGR